MASDSRTRYLLLHQHMHGLDGTLEPSGRALAHRGADVEHDDDSFLGGGHRVSVCA